MKIYSFDTYLFEPDSGKLSWPGGEELLRPKTARSLEVLIENRDRPLSRQELLEIVWKETSVTPNVLYQSIKEIRHCLGGREPSQAYLTSSRNRGYQWVFPDTEAHQEPPPRLTPAVTVAAPNPTVEAAPVAVAEEASAETVTAPSTETAGPARRFARHFSFALAMLVSTTAGFTFHSLLGDSVLRPEMPRPAAMRAVIPEHTPRLPGTLKIGVVHKQVEAMQPVSCMVRQRLDARFEFVCIPEVQIDQALKAAGKTLDQREHVNLAELLHCDLLLDPTWDHERNKLSYALDYSGGQIDMGALPFETVDDAVAFLVSQVGHQAHFVNTFILAANQP
ncbi:winged helix-turn-helix domain-containing protein [Acanthopleuribacter pedis]|uniref:Winged helix-turn-helix domain-containing protein n=1 Tax=Acanthopleuribacter pedis TaxID=442870 RepID=A0A8J7U841_9BACT|nr:winged helix-turn-helix domain-containing protein [Acanthopleuribacter pedis]MBO1322086.1 winged helix-turn-helix domain-containing protein [Acanthopleuribacter pedis]